MFPCLHTFDEPHSEYLNSLSLSPDGILLVGCFHNLVKVWDLTTGNTNHSFELHGDRYGHFNTLVNPDWKSIILRFGGNELQWGQGFLRCALALEISRFSRLCFIIGTPC